MLYRYSTFSDQNVGNHILAFSISLNHLTVERSSRNMYGSASTWFKHVKVQFSHMLLPSECRRKEKQHCTICKRTKMHDKHFIWIRTTLESSFKNGIHFQLTLLYDLPNVPKWPYIYENKKYQGKCLTQDNSLLKSTNLSLALVMDVTLFQGWKWD